MRRPPHSPRRHPECRRQHHRQPGCQRWPRRGPEERRYRGGRRAASQSGAGFGLRGPPAQRWPARRPGARGG
eukprot:670851-Alexandrium_andersonii.AAC.1